MYKPASDLSAATHGVEAGASSSACRLPQGPPSPPWRGSRASHGPPTKAAGTWPCHLPGVCSCFRNSHPGCCCCRLGRAGASVCLTPGSGLALWVPVAARREGGRSQQCEVGAGLAVLCLFFAATGTPNRAGWFHRCGPLGLSSGVTSEKHPRL